MKTQKHMPGRSPEIKGKSAQHFDETYGLNAPENYERYFVPVIGEPLARDLLSYAALSPGESILDVACGTGIVARLARQKVGGKGSVAGLDINPGMLSVARSVSGPDHSINWHQAAAEKMPFPDQTFDVVLCQLGLQFMEDRTAALAEMHRVLSRGGRVVLNLPGPAGDPFAALAVAMEKHIGPEAAGFVNHVFSLHETSRIRDLVAEAEFGEIEIDETTSELNLPPPEIFLWQYIHSTPLAAIASKIDEEVRSAFQRDVLEVWNEFEEGGGMSYRQRIVTVSARK